MIKPADLDHLKEKIYFVPQAILAYDIYTLAKTNALKLEEGTDDFDAFAGAAFYLDNLPFAIMHYRGHPENTSTIYFPYEVSSVDDISKWINRIMDELKLPDKFIWRRDKDETPTQ